VLQSLQAEGLLSPRLERRLMDRATSKLNVTRARWPAGVPVRSTPIPYRWFQGTRARRFTCVADAPGAAVQHQFIHETGMFVCGGSRMLQWEDGTEALCPALEAGSPLAVLMTLTEDDQTVWTRRVVLPVEIVPRLEDVIEPVSSPELDAAIRRGLWIAVSPELPAGGSIRLGLSENAAAALGDAAFAVRIEVLRGSESVANGACWIGSSYFTDPGKAPVSMSGDLAEFARASQTDPRWFIRVRGDAATALRNLDAQRYWAGEVVLHRSRVQIDHWQ
jgi:hypothetical protein